MKTGFIQSCTFVSVATSVVILLGANPQAIAADVSTTSDGDWGGSIWSGSEPTAADIARIDHTVSVTLSGEVAGHVLVGDAGPGGTLNISSGSLTVGSSGFHLGGSAVGTVVQTGGTVDAGSNFRIGQGAEKGVYTVSGGSLVGGPGIVGLGASLSDGELIVQGGAASITFDRFFVGDPTTPTGTLRVQPTANGASGLSTISVTNDLNIRATSVLDFDPQYAPLVGDSWAIATASGGIVGSFSTVTTPTGVTVSVTESPANTLTLEVTAVPDVTAPIADTISPLTTGPTNASSVDFTVVFSEDVANFNDAADVTISHTGTANSGVSITGGPSSYTVSVTGISGDGSFTMAVNTGSDVEDPSMNALGSSVTSTAVLIDNTPPIAAIGAPSATDTNIGPVTFGVTYTGATSVNLTTGDIALNTTGTATATIGVTNGTTSTPTVTLSAISGDGTLGITVNAGTSSDAASNTDAGAGPSSTFNVDNTAPGVSSIVVSGAKGAPVDFIVTFSESVTGVDTSDFALTTTGGITGESVTGVAGSGTTYTVTVDSGTGAGTIRVDVIDDDSITDSAGNPLGGPGTGNGNFTAGGIYSNAVAVPVSSNYGLVLLGLMIAIGAGLAVRRTVKRSSTEN